VIFLDTGFLFALVYADFTHRFVALPGPLAK